MTIMIGILVGAVFGGLIGWLTVTMHSVIIEKQEAKARFEKGYEILSEKKEFLTSSDIHLLEVCSGHKYNEHDLGTL